MSRRFRVLPCTGGATHASALWGRRQKVCPTYVESYTMKACAEVDKEVIKTLSLSIENGAQGGYLHVGFFEGAWSRLSPYCYIILATPPNTTSIKGRPMHRL